MIERRAFGTWCFAAAFAFSGGCSSCAAKLSETISGPPPAPPKFESPDELACGEMIVSAWRGAEFASPEISRTEEESYDRAVTLRARLRQGEDFATIARESSDGAQTGSRGGLFGTFRRGDWPLVYADLRDPLYALKTGEVSDPIRTPFGNVIVRRCPLEKIHLREILIRYEGARNAWPEITRTRDEAHIFVQALQLETSLDPSRFETVARESSEDPSRDKGGDVGFVYRGRLDPEIEKFAWTLGPDQVSDVIETDAGFFIIQRVEGR